MVENVLGNAWWMFFVGFIFGALWAGRMDKSDS